MKSKIISVILFLSITFALKSQNMQAPIAKKIEKKIRKTWRCSY